MPRLGLLSVIRAAFNPDTRAFLMIVQEKSGAGVAKRALFAASGWRFLYRTGACRGMEAASFRNRFVNKRLNFEIVAKR